MTSKEIVEYIISQNVESKYLTGIEYRTEKYTVFNLASDNIDLSISVDDAIGGISYCISDKAGNVRDADTESFDTDEQLEIIIKTIVGVFNVMKGEELNLNIPEEDATVINTDNDNAKDGEEILLEEGEVVSLSDGLKSMKDYMDTAGDKILDLVKATDDPEMKEILTSISNSAYALALDIQEAQQTYIDLQEEDMENPEEV